MLGSTLELLFSIAITADVSVKREHFLEPLLPGNQTDYNYTHSLLAEGCFVISTDQDLEHKTGKTIHIFQAHYLLCCYLNGFYVHLLQIRTSASRWSLFSRCEISSDRNWTGGWVEHLFYKHRS